MKGDTQGAAERTPRFVKLIKTKTRKIKVFFKSSISDIM
jgi:hypothetical protein